MISTVVAGLAAAAVAVLPAATPTPIPTPTPEPKPGVVQLCAATGVAQVDALLADLTGPDLVGPLAPLVQLTVPKGADGVQLAGVVQLDDVRRALNCTGTGTTPTATAAPTATPTSTATPTTTRAPKPRLPRAAAQTGGGPT